MTASERMAPKIFQSISSAPEILVEQAIDAFAERYEIEVETLSTADESVFFPLPRALRDETAATADRTWPSIPK